QPSPHPARQRRRPHARLGAQIEDVHHLARPPSRVGATHPVVAAVIDEGLLDVEEAVEVDVLLGDADHPPRRRLTVVHAEDANLAGADANQVADRADQRRLSGAVEVWYYVLITPTM